MGKIVRIQEVGRRRDLAPFPRPPRRGIRVTCRGCFNRCELFAGEVGTCGVKRNIAGRVTHTRLRVKGIDAAEGSPRDCDFSRKRA